jgi:hypothetical protein
MNDGLVILGNDVNSKLLHEATSRSASTRQTLVEEGSGETYDVILGLELVRLALVKLC